MMINGRNCIFLETNPFRVKKLVLYTESISVKVTIFREKTISQKQTISLTKRGNYYTNALLT